MSARSLVRQLAVVTCFGLGCWLIAGCAARRGPSLEASVLGLEGGIDALVVPTAVPLRDLSWSDGHVFGIAGHELMVMERPRAGEETSFALFDLPPDLSPRPVLAAQGDRVWLVDEQRLRLYRVTVREPLSVESFVLPGALEGLRFVDLEWDGGRNLLWAVERTQHRVLGLKVDDGTSEVTVALSIGGAGRTGLGFNVPLDVSVDGRGRLWVLDSLNRRVVAVDPESQTPLAVIGGDDPAHRTLLPRPRAMTLDAAGIVWVYDDARGELLRFAPEGEDESILRSLPVIPLPAATNCLISPGSGVFVGQPMNTRILWVADDH